MLLMLITFGSAPGRAKAKMKEVSHQEKSEDEVKTDRKKESQEKRLENRYDVPKDKEEEEFNLNGSNNP